MLASLVLLSVFAAAQTPSTSNNQPGASRSSDASAESVAQMPLEKIGGAVHAPIPINTPQAKYTREARKKKIEGVCLVSIVVDTNGIPQNLKVIRPVGYGLDETAVAAIKKYRFKPAMKDGHPVAAEMKIEVHFRLY